MWTVFQAFVEFVTVLFLIYVLLFWLQGIWNPAPRPGIEPQLPALEGEVLPTGWPGKSGLHASGEGERVIALESW